MGEKERISRWGSECTVGIRSTAGLPQSDFRISEKLILKIGAESGTQLGLRASQTRRAETTIALNYRDPASTVAWIFTIIIHIIAMPDALLGHLWN